MNEDKLIELISTAEHTQWFKSGYYNKLTQKQKDVLLNLCTIHTYERYELMIGFMIAMIIIIDGE